MDIFSSFVELSFPPLYMVETLKSFLLQNQESFGAESMYIVLRTQGLLSLF